MLKLLLTTSLALSCLLAARAPAQDAEPPAEPEFEALLRDGTRAKGPVAGLELKADGSGLILLRGESPRAVALADLVVLSRLAGVPAAPPAAGAAYLALPEGDRLIGTITAADDSSLELAPGSLSDIPVRIPLDRITGIVFSTTPSAPRAVLVERLRDPRRKEETLWLSNGDTRTGSFQGLDATALRFDAGNGAAKIGRERVVALAFDPALTVYPAPDSTFLEVALLDGSRIGVTKAEMKDDRLVGECRAGAPVALPWKNISSISVLGPGIEYLSRREPAAAQFIGYLGRHPERIGRDSTWDGQPIRLGERHHEHGLGMLPRTLAAYRIEPGDAAFQAEIGLDDRAGPQASVIFRVLIDRKEVFASEPIHSGAAPVPLKIDLQGGKLLVLVVEFAERGDVQDSAIWAGARIIRNSAP